MLPLAYYILKVIICSAILFGYYWFFLRNKIFHIYNRFYLLATVVLSLIVPLIRFNLQHTSDAAKTSVIHLLQFVNGGDEYMDEIVIQSHYNHISKEQVLMWIFIAVCGFFAFFLVRSVLKIYSLKRNNPSQEFDGVNIITTEDRSTPFSFFKDIFWNNAIDINTDSGKRILKHEIAHVQEKHSQDKLFINIVMVVFWCNPIFWLIRKELNIIHEFLADKKAVEDVDTSAFAAMILQTTYPGHHFEIANNFFYSPIKRRLAMLTKNNKTKVNYISRLLVLPLAFIVFAAFTLKTKNVVTSFLLKDKTITVVIDAGHGGADNGGMAIDGTKEKDIDLDLIKKIKELNLDGNIKLLFTRETDIYQSPKEKAELATRLGADLFISIHVDSEDKNAAIQKRGLGIWVSSNQFTNSEASKLLASALLASFQKNYGIPVAEQPMQRQKGIWVLQESKCPAVLIEAGYLSDKKDLAYMKSEDGQTQFAKNVLDAIEKYAANKTAGNIPDTSVTTISKGLYVNVKNTDADYLKSTDFKSKALVLVDYKEIGNVGYDYVEKNNVDYSSIVVYDPVKANKIYGEKGMYGAIKLTQRDREGNIIHANSISYDEANQSIRLEGPNSTIKGNLDNALIYADGKIITPAELNKIPPSTISSIDILKGEVLNDMPEAKGKTMVINVALKAKDLDEIRIDVKKEDVNRNKKLATGSDELNKALLIVNGKEEPYMKFDNIPSNNIASVNVIKGKEALNKYGNKARDGVVEVTLKTRDIKLKGISDTMPQKNDMVFTKVEEEAQFPGGSMAWGNYLRKNLNAGTPVDEGWASGTFPIIVQFIVNIDGSISDITILDNTTTKKYPGSKTAQQCIDLISKGPKWIPAKQNGHIVTAYRKQPITFVVTEQ
jgi:N-acetylmuramoyl-L-alanine amidase